MKKLLTIILLTLCVSGMGQNLKKYKVIDTLIQYDNASIVILKYKSGKITRDTICHPFTLKADTIQIMYVEAGDLPIKDIFSEYIMNSGYGEMEHSPLYYEKNDTLPVSGNGQKVSPCNYKIIDTMITYDDGDIFVYKNSKGKFARDTFLHTSTKCKIINIQTCKMLIQENGNIPILPIESSDTDLFFTEGLKRVEYMESYKHGGWHSDGTRAGVWGMDTTYFPIFIGSVTSTMKITGNMYYNSPVYDTVKALMLVCDTTMFKVILSQKAYWLELNDMARNYLELRYRKVNDTTFVTPEYSEALWMVGYEVTQRYSEYPHITQQIAKHREYLGIDKKPLPKNIVVWMSKQITP